MSLQCGIIGLAGVGKTTLFNCLSSSRAQAGGGGNKSNLGMIYVPDDRLGKIDALIKSAKIVPTTVDIVDIPGLVRGSGKGEGVGNKFLSEIRNTDALIHVLRCFDEPSVPHIEGSIDPVRDIEIVELELIVRDLESVEKKLQRLEKMAKSGDREARIGVEVLEVYKQHLEDFHPARTVPLEKESQRWVDDLFLLSAKPVMYVCNVDDDSATSGNAYSQAVKKFFEAQDVEILIIAGKLESEIAELEDPADRKVFLQDVGLDEPGVNKLIRSAYRLLNLQTFFTAGPKEVRAWTIRKGMTAPEAAGVIHSDLERGFIRAEVMKYDDFIRLGSEHACREAGKLFIEGKNYVVQDGDILHIRFNV
ncbi:MAG TPA: redox-regulated ATPase YchF [Bacteroidales bacterium]|nr:redox-regulated ATPase YchF [Bacteroidales bacterium]